MANQRKYQVYDKQESFLQSNALYRAFVSGIGAGKSKVGAIDMIERAKPGRLYMVVAPTYTLLSDATMRSFIEVGEMMGAVDPKDIKRSAPPCIRLMNGAEVLFRSADDPERLRGPNLSGLWLDEASLMDEAAFSVSIGRLREAGEMGWLTATFTPKGRSSWVYRVFATNQPDTFLVRAATWENPFLPPKFFESVKAKYTSAMALQELQGEFTDIEGALFKSSWFGIVDKAPPLVSICRAWDLAATPKDEEAARDPDYTAGVLMGKDANGIRYILNIKRRQDTPKQIEKMVHLTAEADGRHINIAMEREPAASGIAVVDYYRRLLMGYNFRAEPARRDIQERAMPLAAAAEGGSVKLVRGDWNEAFLSEAGEFPFGAHDDQISAASLALWRIRDDPGHGPVHYSFDTPSARKSQGQKPTGKAKLEKRLKSHSGSRSLYARYRRHSYAPARRRIY
jgi:predicted phage terminase large subunit-like protein